MQDISPRGPELAAFAVWLLRSSRNVNHPTSHIFQTRLLFKNQKNFLISDKPLPPLFPEVRPETEASCKAGLLPYPLCHFTLPITFTPILFLLSQGLLTGAAQATRQRRCSARGSLAIGLGATLQVRRELPSPRHLPLQPKSLSGQQSVNKPVRRGLMRSHFFHLSEQQGLE